MAFENRTKDKVENNMLKMYVCFHSGDYNSHQSQFGPNSVKILYEKSL